jgi:hypothetical protein
MKNELIKVLSSYFCLVFLILLCYEVNVRPVDKIYITQKHITWYRLGAHYDNTSLRIQLYDLTTGGDYFPVLNVLNIEIPKESCDDCIIGEEGAFMLYIGAANNGRISEDFYIDDLMIEKY